MKIIEAMKRIKDNKEKVADLQKKIGNCCTNVSYETPVYGDDTGKKILEWTQSCTDISQENVKLLCAIQKTNLSTNVTIELGGKQVTKNIAEWVWRRREYAKLDFSTWLQLGDRGLKESNIRTSTGEIMEVKLVRHFDPLKRDEILEMYRSEPSRIDATLEVVNATTDLIE